MDFIHKLIVLIVIYNDFNIVLSAEMSHFHDQKVKDFKAMMQHFIQEQISFHRRVSFKTQEFETVTNINFCKHPEYLKACKGAHTNLFNL